MSGSVKGVEELKKALASVPTKLANKVLRKELRAGAKVFAAEVRSQAPVETGRVKASVKVRAAKRKRGRIAAQVEVTGGHQGEDKGSRWGGNIIGLVEFGRKGQDPHPFIRHSFAAKEAQVLAQIRAGLIQGIAAIGKG